jgi:hypothetical protein
VEVTHALAEGGRELAYVAMSRARGESHIYVAAPDVAQAAARLAWASGVASPGRSARALSRSWLICTSSAKSCVAPCLRTAQPISSTSDDSY